MAWKVAHRLNAFPPVSRADGGSVGSASAARSIGAQGKEKAKAPHKAGSKVGSDAGSSAGRSAGAKRRRNEAPALPLAGSDGDETFAALLRDKNLLSEVDRLAQDARVQKKARDAPIEKGTCGSPDWCLHTHTA